MGSMQIKLYTLIVGISNKILFQSWFVLGLLNGKDIDKMILRVPTLVQRLGGQAQDGSKDPRCKSNQEDTKATRNPLPPTTSHN
jgi:hypothetical protein